jgi:hypothetical protein
MIASVRLGVVSLLILSACSQSEDGSRADVSVPNNPAPTTPVPNTSVPPTPALDPQVEFVVTGGSWQRGEQSGEYRIVVRNSGYEHVSSRVNVEWLEANPDSGTFVRASRTLEAITDGVYSIGLPKIEIVAGRSELILSGTHTYEYSHRGWRFVLGEPDVVRTISDSTP